MTRAGTIALQEEAEALRFIQPGADTALGAPNSSFPIPTCCLLDISVIKMKSDNLSTKVRGHYIT